MSSYMSYRIATKTSLPQFKSSEFTVNRRFSDFLGLHVKLVHKHLREGLILPVPPEKDSMSMAKVKIAKDSGLPMNFLEHRRSYLERYLNRLVQHPKLLEDPDVREFVESPQDLPKSSSTQAVSVDGVLRVFASISDQVSKLGTKNNEQDQWFEDRFFSLAELRKRLESWFNQLTHLHIYRKEAALSVRNLSAHLNHLASVEEHALVANALTELAHLEDTIEQLQTEKATKEYATLTELVKEYTLILEMVEMAFRTRIRLHQHWLTCADNLTKKRDNVTKLSQNPKAANKLPQAEMEVSEWERRVAQAKEDFERMSATLKDEIEVFNEVCFDDFNSAVHKYLRDEYDLTERALGVWQTFLPHAQKINDN